MRTIYTKTFLLAATCAIALAACRSAPVLEVADAPIESSKSVQAAQVRTAIIAAGTPLGWRLVDAGPGKLEGTLRLREHVAIVTIPYSNSRYSILYKGGENLKGADGTIHKNYNGWVQNLDRAIKGELSRL